MSNQQERLRIEAWIVGFTDGEGCFSVSFIKNKTTKTGWQIFPEFVITQGAKSIQALKVFQTYFGVGKIFGNKRTDNHREHLCRYCVRSLRDLENTIVPFFEKNNLTTYKQNDFLLFRKIILLMVEQKHLTQKGMKQIALLVQKMNRRKPSRFLESSETIRRAPVKTG